MKHKSKKILNQRHKTMVENVRIAQTHEANSWRESIQHVPRIKVGQLQGTMEVAIHTREAILLINGRYMGKGPNINSLYDFAKKANIANKMSRADDPFADYLLSQIETREDEILKKLAESSERNFQMMERVLTNQVRNVDGKYEQALSLTRTGSEKPNSMEFRFSKYGSRALYLVVQFDTLVMLIKTIMYSGILANSDGYVEIHEIWANLRSFLSLGRNYVVTNCRRSDLIMKNRTAISAIEKLVKSGFVDPTNFGAMDELCEYFSKYKRNREH
ncbi:MAG: AcaB family transcriptional regulator [Gammaproteobacteria bacterium]|nr:AcaB family transcriptional regulator [Gammaproteobacteria bacterium]